jgi:hypothetical protein
MSNYFVKIKIQKEEGTGFLTRSQKRLFICKTEGNISSYQVKLVFWRNLSVIK